MAPPSQELEPPANPARFTSSIRAQFCCNMSTSLTQSSELWIATGLSHAVPTPHSNPTKEILSHSLLLEPMTVELQRAAVFGHSANELIVGAVRQPSLDFDRHCHLGPYLTGKVRDYLIGDATGIPSDARRVDSH